MPIQFACPHCGLQTSVSDEYSGQSGPCAGCGKTITVPPLGGGQLYRAPARRSGGPILLVVALLAVPVLLGVIGILIALLLPAVQAAREAARRASCTNNMKQLALAMHNYNAAHGCFPPAYLADEDGKPMHSWRVLILPYLEEQLLYEQYDFDQPWDSPHNLALAAMMPRIYRCPSSPGENSLETSYMMIVGPGTISDGTGASRLRDITDGTSNTIMLVEADQSTTNWMEPRDLDATRISYEVNEGINPGIGSEHPGVANAAFCDGSVRSIDDWTDPELIKSMTTIAGGEDVSEFR